MVFEVGSGDNGFDSKIGSGVFFFFFRGRQKWGLFLYFLLSFTLHLLFSLSLNFHRERVEGKVDGEAGFACAGASNPDVPAPALRQVDVFESGGGVPGCGGRGCVQI